MKILPVSVYQQKNNYKKHQSFGVNYTSPELSYQLKDFFINIQGYGTNYTWASRVKQYTNQAVTMIRNNAQFEDVLHHIAQSARQANSILGEGDKEKIRYTGILRCKRDGWEELKDVENTELYTPYGFAGSKKYYSYTMRLNKIAKKPLQKPFDKISLSTTTSSSTGIKNYISHGESDYINSALFYTEKIYNDIQKNYIKKEVKEHDLNKVNNKMARMRWILAHSTPWARGSDLISNMLMRAMYKAMGIKLYPTAPNISLDLEAYCTPMEQYMKNFPSYFEHPPIIPK